MRGEAKPPAYLSARAKRWWAQVLADYDLEAHQVEVLRVAAEAMDRAEQARRILAAEGVTYLDRFGAPRKHPAVAIEENARLQFVRCVRELALEGDGPIPDVRPPRIRSVG